ncbi:MAG: hypothetical protein M1117_05650 [Candidatus Thermoplasmatota archaeon]|nr:hypothetical protein [Candidatus Thermoplasmatota archaeon]
MIGAGKFMAISVAALMLLSAASLAVGDTGHQHPAPNMPEMEIHDHSIIVSNSKITVWFQGFKPMLHIFYRNQSNTTGFTIDVRGVYEINSTGVPVAVLSTVRAFPDMQDMNGAGAGIFNYSSGVSVTYDSAAQMVNITFSLTSEEFALSPNQPMPGQGGSDNQNAIPADDGLMHPSSPVGQGSIAIVFHVNESSAHVKFDLLVNHWTWLNSTGDRLALVVAVVGHQSVRGDQGQEPTSTGTEMKDNRNNDNSQNGNAVANSNDNSQGSDSGNSVIIGSSFMQLGYISWGSTATATYSNGTTTPVSVNVTMFSHGIEEAGVTHIWFVFTPPAGWATNYSKLVYDPTAGLSGSLTATSYAVIGGAAAVALLAGISVVLIRRKR